MLQPPLDSACLEQGVNMSISTQLAKIWLAFPNLKRDFWKEKTFWSDGYFVCSVGNASAEMIRRYIQEQG